MFLIEAFRFTTPVGFTHGVLGLKWLDSVVMSNSLSHNLNGTIIPDKLDKLSSKKLSKHGNSGVTDCIITTLTDLYFI